MGEIQKPNKSAEQIGEVSRIRPPIWGGGGLPHVPPAALSLFQSMSPESAVILTTTAPTVVRSPGPSAGVCADAQSGRGLAGDSTDALEGTATLPQRREAAWHVHHSTSPSGWGQTNDRLPTKSQARPAPSGAQGTTNRPPITPCGPGPQSHTRCCCCCQTGGT